MRVLIVGFTGLGNAGDEAILQGLKSILQDFDPDIGIDVATELPFTFHKEYNERADVGVRTLTNYDFGEGETRIGLLILGGGGLATGYGMGLVMRAKDAGIPILNIGIEYKEECRNLKLFQDYLRSFDDIVVRTEESSEYLRSLGISHHLGFCPSIRVEEQKMFDLPDKYVLVTPRKTSDKTHIQVDTVVNELNKLNLPAVLLPFSKFDISGHPIDVDVCYQIQKKYKNSKILPIDGYDPKIYLDIFRTASFVLNSGRLHSSIFAARYGIPTMHTYPAESEAKIKHFLSYFGMNEYSPWEKGFGSVIDFSTETNRSIMAEITEQEKCNSEVIHRYLKLASGTE